MDKRIREVYSDAVLTEALARYGVTTDSAHLLDGFESFIYEYEKDGQGYVLRITHSSRRTADLIGGEVDWINYLADHGVPAARAALSERGRLVETIEAQDGQFLAVAFKRAPGTYPRHEDWERGLIVQVGQVVGRMHALTKDYRPSEPRFQRHTWYDDADGFAARYLPPSEATVIGKYNALVEYLRTLPKDRDSYGLVHIDVHGMNFYVHEGQITLFDFDDCQYAWFAYDVAMALFYTLPHHCVGEENVAFAQDAFKQFMDGYRRENTLAPEWLKRIPLFMKLREIDLYIAIHRSFDLDDLDPWCASFMRDRKYKIEHDVPYVDMSFG